MDPYLGEIKLVGFNFAPRGWAFCEGQLLPIRQNTALFSLLGTNFGGDGFNTFALPDMRGKAPVHWGPGPGLSDYYLGDTGGEAAVTLSTDQIPAHTHTLSGENQTATAQAPSGELLAAPLITARFADLYSTAPGNALAHPVAISPTGSSFPHNNLQPYLALNFIIALEGIYPVHP